MKVEWLPIAERNRQNQIAYVAERNPSAALDIGDAIESSVLRLSSHPHSGRLGRIAGTRELVLPGTPYVIAYRVEGDSIVILRLLHGAQQWPSEL